MTDTSYQCELGAATHKKVECKTLESGFISRSVES